MPSCVEQIIKKGKNHPKNAIKWNIMKYHSRITQRRASPLRAVTLLNHIQSLKLHFLDYPVSQDRHQVLHNFLKIHLFVVYTQPQLKLSSEQDLGFPRALITRCAHSRKCTWGGKKGKKIQFKSMSTIPRMSLWTGPTTQTQPRWQAEFWQSSNWFRIPYLTRSHLFRDGNNERGLISHWQVPSCSRC